VDGDVGPNGNFDVHSDWTDTLDVLDKIDFALDARVRSEWRRWRFTASVDGATLSDSIGIRDGALAREGSLDVWTASLTAGYVFAGGRTDCSPCPGTWCLDVYAGIRYWDVDLEVEGIVGAAPGVDRGDEWLDPIVGLHLDVEWRRWVFVAEADVGGFGLGSDFSWSALGSVGFRFTRWLGLFVGWKVMAADRDEDDFVFDATLSGPFAALAFTF
jgi:hypothetical protein